MRITYCTNVRLPSERAHGHQIAQVCDALTQLGNSITIFAPYRCNPVKEDIYTYYGISEQIQFRVLGKFDPINRFWLPGVTGLWILNWLLKKEYRRVLTPSSFDLIYTRVPALLPVLHASSIPVVLELHRLPSMQQAAFVRDCERSVLIVCLTSAMRDELVRWGVSPARIIVEGDAFDPALFTNLPGKENARKALGISSDRPVIGYAGQLASMGLSKGLPELLSALKLLYTQKVSFQAIIAGGPLAAQHELEQSLPVGMRSSVKFLGHVEHAAVPQVLSACDVLVYPAPQSTHAYYHRDTSPLKLFEYMAANRPIVSADLPPLHDVIDDTMVKFCVPGNAASMADAIKYILMNPREADTMTKNTHERVQSHTWEQRMKRILDAITNRL